MNLSLEPRPTGGSSLPPSVSSQTDTQPLGDQSPDVQWQVPGTPREIQLLQGPGERATVFIQSRQDVSFTQMGN